MRSTIARKVLVRSSSTLAEYQPVSSSASDSTIIIATSLPGEVRA